MKRSHALVPVLIAAAILLAACGSEPESANAKLAQDTDLSESWGCGIGFAASNPEQTVAIFIYSNDHEPNPPVTFPDSNWDARLVVGKDLMANHCDDVIEPGKPEQVITEEWSITSGTLEFEVPQGGLCGAAGPVVGELRDLQWENSDSTVDFGDLTVINDAYGCFAG